jgi:hypothetical protein
MMKTIIVTGSDENFSSLFLDLISSLHQWDARLSDAIGVLDCGLSDATLQQVRERVTHIVTPDWDFAIDPSLRDTAPHLRALLARPFLPKYFPGYDLYLWLDADTWLQESYAVKWFFQAAINGAIGIVPHLHQSYRKQPSAAEWGHQRIYAYFGDRGIALSLIHHAYNAGAFALRATSAHWDAWARYFALGLKASPRLVSDQAALNYAIWNDDLPVHPLPALCNWLCHLAIPSINFETKKFCEPHIPNREIGLIHLTTGTKDQMIKFDHNGISRQTNLRFGGLSSLT